MPAFRPEVTRYEATNGEAVIDQFITGDDATVPDPLSNRLTTTVALAEGVITNLSLRMLAADEATARTYHSALSRTAAVTTPRVTIEANRSEYVAGLGPLVYTLTREGDVSASLEVTVNLEQTENWLTSPTSTADFDPGESLVKLILAAGRFSPSVTQSGELIATIAPVAGYDTSEAQTRIRVFSQEGPAVRVTIEHPKYTFDESVGSQATFNVVARAVAGLPYAGGFSVSVTSEPLNADPGHAEDALTDYLPLSETIYFEPSDFQDHEGVLVGRKQVALTIVDDDAYEGDEVFLVHLGMVPGSTREVQSFDSYDNGCTAECPLPYVVTIADNDHAPTLFFSTSASRISETDPSAVAATVTVLSDNGSSYYDERIITVRFGGMATLGNDYTVAPADEDTTLDGHQITLKPGASQVAFTVTAVKDTIPDTCEQITISAKYGWTAIPIDTTVRIEILD